MKWIILVSTVVLMTGCYSTNPVEYRQVAATPLAAPVAVYSFPQPIDVTAATIDYY
jgi:hypothetical protein